MNPKPFVIFKLVNESAPPRVKFPEVATVPLKDIPLTVPVPPTEVTVPSELVLLLKVFQSPWVK